MIAGRYSYVLDVLVQSRRDAKAAKRLLRKLLKKQMRAPRVLITDKLKSYGAARRKLRLGSEHRQHKGPRRELASADTPTRTTSEALHVGPTSAALSVHPRPDRQPLSPAPQPPVRHRIPHRPRSGLRDLG